MKNAIVIGSGIGGLASAVRLAVKGYEVQVFESNSYPGGKLSELSKNGFRFDAGPSLFTMPELVDELFFIAGKDPKDFFKYSKLNKICNYFYSDGTSLTAYSDVEKFIREAVSKTGVEEKILRNHLNKSRFIFDATSHLFIERSLHKISSYLRFQTFLSILKLPFLDIFKTMDDSNSHSLRNEKMRQLFNRYATYNGSSPYKAPGILNIIPHLEFSKGAFFPDGGMHAITNSVFELAKSLGVRFVFKSNVEKILVENDKAVGVKVGENKIMSDLIVCNSDIFPTYKKLLTDQPPPEKILTQERSSSALIFYWGVNMQFEHLELHNIFFSGDYKNEFIQIFENNNIGNDPTVYINITSKYKKDDAPEGMENWFVMINVPSNIGQDWNQLIKKARNSIIEKLNKILNVQLESLIISEEILDPVKIESKTNSYQGSLYGTASNSRMAAFFRHPNFTSKIKNLYFCGGSVHPGGGIPLALSSAKIVDSLVPALK